VPAYSILTLSTLPRGVHGTTAEYRPGDFAPRARDEILPLPYRDDFAYAGYPATVVGGRRTTYLERRGGTPRYTADQDGAFEVTGTVLEQRIHAENRGYVWNVWGDGRQNVPSTAAPSTVLGDHRWADYTATVDIRLDPVDRDPALPNFAGLGVRQTHARGGDQATYAVRVHEDGRWELRRLDVVVASGTVTEWDAGAWHTLSVTASGSTVTATLDGAHLASYADTSPSPVLTGRVALVSGYYNTRYDNLAITPVPGRPWRSEKIDDADPRVAYPDGSSFVQAGFAHFNRTQHVLTTGRSVTFEATGTGVHLFGATGAATLEVRVDDRPPVTAEVGVVGTRQTSYRLGDLPPGRHRVTVRVTGGTLTLDGIDVLR
jgi:hypothetical protein